MVISFDTFHLAASTSSLADEPRARKSADLLEYRMDLAPDPLDALKNYQGSLPIIVTNRAASEGGRASGSNRLSVLERAVSHESVAAVDIELSVADTPAAENVIESATSQDVAVIISAHDFEQTPPVAEITAILERGSKYGTIAKFAALASTHEDTLRLLRATSKTTEAGFTVATMGMGAVGQHTRAVAPVYGSRLGYAPIDTKDATAPGQYDLETLRLLVDTLTQ